MRLAVRLNPSLSPPQASRLDALDLGVVYPQSQESILTVGVAYENGASALLLQISGTIPVVFRGSSYGFPVQIWVPHAYPRESPMVYVIPSQDMLVRPGQHVSGDGRVYHPYLARWGEFWDKSTLYDFLAVLKGVFAKEPPVRSKVQQQPAPQAPPPVPPTPAEWRRSMQNPSVASGSPGPSQSYGAPVPPPKPPKPYEQGGPSPRPQSQVQQGRYSQPPPLPPHPTQQPPPPQNQYEQPQRNSYAGQSNWQQHGPPQQMAPRQGNYDISPSTPVARPPQPHVQSQNYPPQPYNVGSPVSPITPENQRAPNRQYQQPAPPPQPHPPNFPQPQQHPHPQTQPPPHPSYGPPSAHLPHQLPHPYPLQFQQPPPQPAPPPPNLMDMDTLEVTLPSQSGPQHPTSVPPVPPNPEKDALLSALSSTLVASTRRTVEQNLAAVSPLQAQQAALQTARAKLTAELEQMGQLEKALERNEGILREVRFPFLSSSQSFQPESNINTYRPCTLPP